MYQKGEGVPQNNVEAVKWFHKAAEQRDADAQFWLGVMYRYGKGVPQDHAEAVKWYSKAAEQGHVDAQKTLDGMKTLGMRVGEDEGKPLPEQRITSTTSDSKNKKSSTTDRHLHDVKECKALLDACTPNLYKQNIFRISGIHINASPRDFKRRFDDLKTAAEMGDLKDELNHAFALNPIPNIDQIREAAQRFQDPEKRIVDEFSGSGLWTGVKVTTILLQMHLKIAILKALHIWSNALPGDNLPQCTIAKHNLAVLHHLKAIDSEIKALDHDLPAETLNAISKDWHTWFKWWKDLVDDEDCGAWSQYEFAQLTTHDLQPGLPVADAIHDPGIDKINAMLAIRFCGER